MRRDPHRRAGRAALLLLAPLTGAGCNFLVSTYELCERATCQTDAAPAPVDAGLDAGLDAAVRDHPGTDRPRDAARDGHAEDRVGD